MFFHLGLFFCPQRTCYVKGQSLRCSRGRGNAGGCAVTQGGGAPQEGAMALVLLSARFQSLPPLPIIKLGPSSADSHVGGLVYVVGPCGSLQQPLL